jgi:hypothetical protein
MGDTPRDVARCNENKDIDFPDDSPRGVPLGYNEGPSEWNYEYAFIYPNGNVVRHVACKPEFHGASVTTGASGSGRYSGISCTNEWRCEACGGGAPAHKEFVMGCTPEEVREADIVECFRPADCFATRNDEEVCVYIPPGMEDPGVWIVCWSSCICSTEDEYKCIWSCRREEAEDPCDSDFMREIST